MKCVLEELLNINSNYGINLVLVTFLITSQGHCCMNYCGKQIMFLTVFLQIIFLEGKVALHNYEKY